MRVASTVEPAVTVSRKNAAAYALRWAEGRHPAYRSFDNDCTNFISQALLNGGMKMRGTSVDEGSKWAWWYKHGPVNALDSWSHPWSVAHDNYRFHQATERGRVVSKYWGVTIGDLLYADWEEDGRRDHVMIFTGNSPKDGLRVSGHTSDRKNVDASWWMAKAKADDSNNSVGFDYYHINYGEF